MSRNTNNHDTGSRREGDLGSDGDSSPSTELIGNILRAVESAVAAPIQQLAPDYRSETYSIASRQRARSVVSSRSQRRKTIPIEDQRHPGKPGVKISRNTRNIEEVLESEVERAAKKERDQSQDSEASTIQEDESVYPGPIALTILLISICLQVFLVSLDRTIITTVLTLSKI